VENVQNKKIGMVWDIVQKNVKMHQSRLSENLEHVIVNIVGNVQQDSHDTRAACDGWILRLAGTLGCCSGKCTKLQKDWIGLGYCPADCKGGRSKLPGTCNI
jgi:hypothetical protein